ncbi:MAG: polysaccharide pyruvyl transferase family protein [Candidatus Aphodosoma sp.]
METQTNCRKEYILMNKVILTTVFSGYNYGSSLQAFAGKTILNELGYDCQLVAMKSLVKGRDIRIKKLATILWRSLTVKGTSGSKSLNTYQSSYNKTMIGDSAARFAKFTDEVLQPSFLSWNELQRLAKKCKACFAGSDQIWNSSTLYVDPLYYLRFAPAEKRVAFAPSFGRDFIADYNKELMGKWISEFAHISVREDSGVRLINELTGRDAVNLVDPTLMLDGEIWRKMLNITQIESNYILAYFLDKPSEKARTAIKDMKKKLGCEIIAIPYQFDEMDYCDKMVSTGPIEFLTLINNAKCVLTDSFHGTVFSINFHTPFYVFERNYGSAQKQSSRIMSLLTQMNMLDRYDVPEYHEHQAQMNFSHADVILEYERSKFKQYIVDAISSCNK